MEPENFLLSLQSGDESAISRIYNHYFMYLVHYAAEKLGSYWRAKDVVHDVFYELLSKGIFNRLDSKTPLLFYIRSCVRNRCHAVTTYKTLQMLSQLPPDVLELPEEERKRIVIPDLSFFPEKTQRIFNDIYIEGKKHKEVGAEMNMKKTALSNQISRGIHLLQKKFTVEDFIKSKFE